ncbi:hypothetical protein [Nocardia brasiliensis]
MNENRPAMSNGRNRTGFAGLAPFDTAVPGIREARIPISAQTG